ncbi:MAG: hypothetical protein D6802_09870, partial [Ardenticatenia bacterium]
MTSTPPEKAFEAWARRQSYEMQKRAFLRQLQRMQWLEFIAYVLAFAWVLVMFIAFQMGRDEHHQHPRKRQHVGNKFEPLHAL